ncbi:hypothetical protein JCM18899A_54560 [Nocardioides sp. AN3]
MSENDRRRAAIVAAWTAAWDEGDVDAMDALWSPSCRIRYRHGEEGRDMATYKKLILATRVAFPDLATAIDDVVVEGDRAAVRWHSVGTHLGAFMDVPPTGRHLEVGGLTLARFDGDLIVEELVTTDEQALLAAVGILSVGKQLEQHRAGYAPAAPDVEVMKEVNRRFVTGVTVVSAMDGEAPRGLAVNAFASISLDPPTVMICVQRTSTTHASLYATDHLGINFLSTEQLDVVNTFADKAPDKFAGLAWEPGPFGSPLIAGSSAQAEVEIRERLQASTHTIFICRVVHATVSDHPPMVYSAGSFFDGASLRQLG